MSPLPLLLPAALPCHRGNCDASPQPSITIPTCFLAPVPDYRNLDGCKRKFAVATYVGMHPVRPLK